jgi:imidazolonepropionase-like amidohydrolase
MLAVINGRVFPVSSGPVEQGTVLIDGGKIVAVGAGLAIPEAVDVIDATGCHV